MGKLNSKADIKPVNDQEGQNGLNIQRQTGNNNIIYMADDRGRANRDYTVLTLQAIQPGIVIPEVQVVNFELK